MTYNATINLGTVSSNITHVSVYTCEIDCNQCVPLTGYQNVTVAFFPLTIYNIPDTVQWISVVVVGGDCDGQSQCFKLENVPT